MPPRTGQTRLISMITAAIMPALACAETVQTPHRCDHLAALEADPGHTAAPVAFADIIPDAVITACLEAIAASNGDEPRYFLQLGRGYLRGGEVDAALAAFTAAHDAGYPAATFALGMMYFLGDDIAADHDRAFRLFTKAHDQGVAYAVLGLAEMHTDPMSPLHDEAAAKQWREIWRQQHTTPPRE